MAVKRPTTRSTLIRNLTALMDVRGWNQSELARQSGVSQRMISHLLRDEASCSIETAEALATAFGLNGWHLLLPNLPHDLLDSPSLRRLVDSYISAPQSGRALFDLMAERERKPNHGK